MVVVPGRPNRGTSEEAEAATRLVLGLSAAVGVVGGAMGLVGGLPMAVLLAPTVILVGALLARSIHVSGWAAAALWAIVLPHAHAEAMIAPIVMVVACLSLAIGPDRLLRVVARDWHGRPRERPETSAWIDGDIVEDLADTTTATHSR